MNDKKYKRNVAIMVALLVISVALFAIDNFVLVDKGVDATLENTTNTETMTIYRAVEDIPAYSVVSPTMFERVTVPKMNDIGFITDINMVTGMYARGTIFKGNFITNTLFSDEDFEAGLAYSMEIRADLVGNIQYGDIVDVYAVSGDVVTQIFARKKLYQQIGQPGLTLSRIFIKVNRSELMTYYSMMNSNKFILAPVDTAQLSPLDESTVGDMVTYGETNNNTELTNTENETVEGGN